MESHQPGYIVSGLAYERARCSGIAAQFHFFFGVYLGEKVLGLADNLSKSLQHQNISAAQGKTMAALTIQSLRDMRTDEEFDSFLEGDDDWF